MSCSAENSFFSKNFARDDRSVPWPAGRHRRRPGHLRRQVLRLPPQLRRAGTEPLRDEAQRPAVSGDGDPGPQGNANASLRPAPVAGRGVADSRLREVDRLLLRRPADRTVFTNLPHLELAPGAAQLAAGRRALAALVSQFPEPRMTR